MTSKTQKKGFSYFSSPEYMVSQNLNTWIPSLKQWGGSFVIFKANFDIAVPEDAFIFALDHGLEPFVHFNTSLPSARVFNEASLMLEIYKKWGCKHVIFGDQPNTKNKWHIANWHYETLVDQFLDRFIPLAVHAVKNELNPILAPLLPGGDYWDCAFLELLLDGLKHRKMERVLNKLSLSSYGYTFHKPLSWGAGGPERWPGSIPYQTPDGQEDQIGFHNFEWVQAASERITGRRMPVMILDAGRPSPVLESQQVDNAIDDLKMIVSACSNSQSEGIKQAFDLLTFNDLVLVCTFSMDTLKALLGSGFSIGAIDQIFGVGQESEAKNVPLDGNHKYLRHYLLLPTYASGVSDVVLNKVRPIIKKYRPTVGFSLEEASLAAKVSIFPDPYQFPDEQINQLRSAGCQVEILPDSGIEIATNLQG